LDKYAATIINRICSKFQACCLLAMRVPGRVLARLVEERRAEELSYPTVRHYVRVRRAHVDVEAGRRAEVLVPQEPASRAAPEVDLR
jgi:hypothetical protein